MRDDGQQAGRVTDVLVVNDDIGLQAMLREILHEEGYAVRTAWNGRQALEVLSQADTPYVVLLDDLMPYMDGIEVLQIRAATPALVARTACVFMTARPEPLPDDLVKLLTRLQVPVLLYPFSVAGLLRAVEEAASTLVQP